MGAAEGASTARHRSARAGVEYLERADRRDHHRQAQFAAEYLGGRVDPGDIAQDPRPERNLVEGHAVAAHGGLGLRGADDIVPGVLVEPGAGFAHEFVEILEFLAAGAELDIPRRLDGGPVIHAFSLPF